MAKLRGKKPSIFTEIKILLGKLIVPDCLAPTAPLPTVGHLGLRQGVDRPLRRLSLCSQCTLGRVGNSSGVSVDAGRFEGQGLALGLRCPGKKLQVLDGILQLGLSTLYLSQSPLLGRQQQWIQSAGVRGWGLHPNSSSLTQPKSVPGLSHGSHQTFQPVALIAWRIAPWIQLRSPVGITGEWKESEAEGLPESSWLESGTPALSLRWRWGLSSLGGGT